MQRGLAGGPRAWPLLQPPFAPSTVQQQLPLGCDSLLPTEGAGQSPVPTWCTSSLYCRGKSNWRHIGLFCPLNSNRG